MSERSYHGATSRSYKLRFPQLQQMFRTRAQETRSPAISAKHKWKKFKN